MVIMRNFSVDFQLKNMKSIYEMMTTWKKQHAYSLIVSFLRSIW